MYLLYLNRVYESTYGITLEVEDYLARHNVETTRYVNLYSKGDYDYTISVDDGVHLDINGLNRSIYIANDIPFSKTIYHSNDIVTDIIEALK